MDESEELTFELRVSPRHSWAKEKVIAFLESQGRYDWVETLEGDDMGNVEPYKDDGIHSFHHFSNHKTLDLKLYFLAEETREEFTQTLRTQFHESLPLSLTQYASADWKWGWQKQLPEIVTRDFIVHAPWIKGPFDASKIAIEIDPGMAFGTGHHPTTLLCLHALEIVKDKWGNLAGSEFWDVGTGTGILAIAAKKIGMAHVFCGDIDPDANRIAAENAEINKVSIQVLDCPKGEVASWKNPYGHQIVLANIISSVLIEIMPNLVAMFSPSAKTKRLILSGLLDSQMEEVLQSLKKEVPLAELLFSTSEDGWTCLFAELGTAKL